MKEKPTKREFVRENIRLREALEAIAPFALEDYELSSHPEKWCTKAYLDACEKLIKVLNKVDGSGEKE